MVCTITRRHTFELLEEFRSDILRSRQVGTRTWLPIIMVGCMDVPTRTPFARSPLALYLSFFSQSIFLLKIGNVVNRKVRQPFSSCILLPLHSFPVFLSISLTYSAVLRTTRPPARFSFQQLSSKLITHAST